MAFAGPFNRQGEQGPAGKNGKNGIDGTNGRNGKNGKDGVDGKNGKDGITKVIYSGEFNTGDSGGGGSTTDISVSTDVDYTITDEDFVRGYGANPIIVTLTDADTNTKRRTIKNVGERDLTIVGVLGQPIDEGPNIILRGGRKNSVTLYSEDGEWWIT